MNGFVKVNICGIPIASADFSSVIEILADSGLEGQSVHFANAKTVVDAHQDSGYSTVLRDAWMVLPDGAPIARLISKCTRRSQSRIAGPDVFESLMGRPGLRHFLIAPSQEASERLIRKWRFQIVGAVVPAVLEHWEFPLQDLAAAIRTTGATHVWIGLGSPKQDYLATALSRHLTATVLAVGAAMEFSANLTRRAPLVVQRLGLEWLHRLCTDPKRLWKRYLIGNLRFLMIARSANEVHS